MHLKLVHDMKMLCNSKVKSQTNGFLESQKNEQVYVYFNSTTL